MQPFQHSNPGGARWRQPPNRLQGPPPEVIVRPRSTVRTVCKLDSPCAWLWKASHWLVCAACWGHHPHKLLLPFMRACGTASRCGWCLRRYDVWADWVSQAAGAPWTQLVYAGMAPLSLRDGFALVSFPKSDYPLMVLHHQNSHSGTLLASPSVASHNHQNKANCLGSKAVSASLQGALRHG